VHLHPAIPRFYLKSFADTFLSKAFEEMRCKTVNPHEDTNLHLFSNPVGGLVTREPVSVPFGLSIQAAAREMIRQNTGSLLFREPSGEICGIVTDTDLRKAMALGLDLQAPAETIMSTPVESIDASAVCFDALLTMMSKNIHHLVVKSHNKLQGIISSHDIMLLQGRSPMSVFREIASRTTIDGLYPLHDSITPVIRTLVQQGAKAGNITRMIAILNDQIMSKLLDLMLRELGPPPVKFCLLLMGSEGRREQTFATDQDNALIIENCSVDFLERAADTYFSAFTERMVGHLIKVRIPALSGQHDGLQPPVARHRGYVERPGQHLDHRARARARAGQLSVLRFQGRVRAQGPGRKSAPARHQCLRRKGPLPALSGRGLPERQAAADLLQEFHGRKGRGAQKHAGHQVPRAAAFMDFARVMALYHGIRETSTLGRLELLHQEGHLSRDLFHEAREAFRIPAALAAHAPARTDGAGHHPGQPSRPRQIVLPWKSGPCARPSA
jgi:Predicted signal-transduction protein containing cAMP-binding and CBS domains